MKSLTLSLLSLAALISCGCGMFRQDQYGMRAHQLTRQRLDPDSYRAEAVSFEEEEEGGLALEDLHPDKVFSRVKTMTGNGPNPTLAREYYGDAQGVYRQAAAEQGEKRQELFAQAAERFASATKLWRGSSLEQDALYWSGQSYFFADQYPESNEQFELLLKQFPNSKYLDQAEARRFSIAMYWLQLNEHDPQRFYDFNFLDPQRPWRDSYGNALRILDRIRIDDPTGKLADDATLAAANAHFASGSYVKADEYYTDLRKTFPSSEHQFTAHFLGMQSKIRSYQGSDYSGNVLEEAEKLIKQMQRQFPHEGKKNKEYLDRAYAEVRFKQAERKWARASYHERRGEYDGARFFYASIRNEFPDTPMASRATERLATIADRPGTPPQRLSWLVNALPADDDGLPAFATNPNANDGVQRR